MACVSVVVKLSREEIVIALTAAAKDAAGFNVGSSNVEYTISEEDGKHVVSGASVTFNKTGNAPLK